MRTALGLLSLLIALAAVALLARKSLPPPGVAPVLPQASAPLPAHAPAQARQVQDQYRQALDSALQQARPASVDE